MQKQKPPAIGDGPSENDLPEGASPELLAAAQKAKEAAQKAEETQQQDHADDDEIIRVCFCGDKYCGVGPFILWRKRGRGKNAKWEAVGGQTGKVETGNIREPFD